MSGEMESSKQQRKAHDRDGLYRRRGYWHFEYRDPETGQWHSKTTGATAYNEAKTFRREFLDELKKNYVPTNDRLRFSDAADAYIKHREISVAPGTVRLEKERLRALKKCLAQIANPDVRLKDFTITLVRAYQQGRIGNGVGPRTVNMECQLLRSLLKHCGQWKLDGKYKPLPEPVSQVGRALTPIEEVRLFDTAKSRPERLVAYHASVLENETGMRGAEVRNLQLKDVDLDTREIHIRKSKTAGGIRTIPLNFDALESVKVLRERAVALGATEPEHFLIPRLVKTQIEGKNGQMVSARRYDPTKPITSWRTAWRALTVEAGLKGLRGHDLRHNWVTGHAEIGTSQSVLEAQAGHLSKQMSDHYTHISAQAARKAADELARTKAAQRAEARAKMVAQAHSVHVSVHDSNFTDADRPTY